MASQIPKNQQALISSISQNRQTLYKTLDELEASDSYDPNLQNLEGQVKDTTVSACNLLAYLLGWSNIVIDWLASDITNTKHNNLLPKGYNFSSKHLGRLALSFYSDYDHLSYNDIKNKLHQSYDKILQLLNAQSNSVLYEKPFHNQYSLGRMVDFNTRCPLANVNKRLRWLRKSLLS